MVLDAIDFITCDRNHQFPPLLLFENEMGGRLYGSDQVEGSVLYSMPQTPDAYLLPAPSNASAGMIEHLKGETD